MKILSRGQLAKVIKVGKIENTMGEFEGKSANFTTVYNKKKDSFHRVIWGEVIDKGQTHIWFNEFAEEVKVSPNGEWMTKSELRDYQNSLRMGKKKHFDELTLMRTRSIDKYSKFNNEIASSLIEGESILYISTEHTPEEITNRALKNIAGDSYVSLVDNKANTEELNDISESASIVNDLNVIYEPLLNTNRIKDIMKSNSKVDLFIIDRLKFNDNNYHDVAKIQILLDDYAQICNCKMLIYTKTI